MESLSDICKLPTFSQQATTGKINKRRVITDMYGTYEATRTPSGSQETSTLSKDDDNVIRYAYGYTVRTMLIKYLKQHGEKGAIFVQCIARMQADHTDDKLLSTFLAYTHEWVKTVNRGGLYKVKDEVYLLFREIEVKMQSHLMVHLKTLSTTHYE